MLLVPIPQLAEELLIGHEASTKEHPFLVGHGVLDPVAGIECRELVENRSDESFVRRNEAELLVDGLLTAHPGGTVFAKKAPFRARVPAFTCFTTRHVRRITDEGSSEHRILAAMSWLVVAFVMLAIGGVLVLWARRLVRDRGAPGVLVYLAAFAALAAPTGVLVTTRKLFMAFDQVGSSVPAAEKSALLSVGIASAMRWTAAGMLLLAVTVLVLGGFTLVRRRS